VNFGDFKSKSFFRGKIPNAKSGTAADAAINPIYHEAVMIT
jgi:hypothetical protein